LPRTDQITRQWQLLIRLEGSTGLTLNNLVESVPDGHPRPEDDGTVFIRNAHIEQLGDV
jgi:hypothetical protein